MNRRGFFGIVLAPFLAKIADVHFNFATNSAFHAQQLTYTGVPFVLDTHAMDNAIYFLGKDGPWKLNATEIVRIDNA